MTYMIRNSGKLNLVLSHPDNIDTSNWTREQYSSELRRYYGDMDPCVRRLIDLSIGPITNWPVHQVAKLPAWKSDSGKFVLIGDAAHAMAFYLSMGVSLAIEDATALCTALELCLDDGRGAPLDRVLDLFERVRKPRAEKIRDASLHAGTMLHLPPGSKRDIRDVSARNDGATTDAQDGDMLLSWISYGITDKMVRAECFGYNIVAELHRQAASEGLRCRHADTPQN